ncbi:hypothetical protein PVAP13_8KG076900 [Panicum virgatum]|uniref:Uncharacterized protein n=1 Tax=Panicum virgatum TaxID=38727 RepID=A0A8T0PJ55_PANVG|nr:hypothetical protein PVAP13_8KG076900 [Panicum virgatum]
MSSSVDLVKMDGRGWLCRRAPQIQQALEVGHYEGSWEDEARKAAHGQAPRIWRAEAKHPFKKKKSFFRSHGYWLCFLLATMGFIVNGSKRWGNPHDFCPHSMKKWEFDVLVRSASDCTSLNLC